MRIEEQIASTREIDSPVKTWPDYRAVWRWHFYAGLICIPFVVILSITGALYLFKTEVEAWVDHEYDQIAVNGPRTSAADQIRAALNAVPGSDLNGYEVPATDTSSARVIVSKDGVSTRVYVDTQTLAVLKMVPEEERLMRVLFKLHGELLMGNRGSAVVEIAASWTIIMIITGLFLWFPRKVKGLGGILYPRLGSGSKILWRDLHSVTGFWISGLALFLLVSGLPWAKFWGDYFKNIRRLTGTAVAIQDWSNGTANPVASESHAGHEGGGSPAAKSGRGSRRRVASTPTDLSPVDRIVATLRPLQLEPPVVIAPPAPGEKSWTAKSNTPNRPRRVDLMMDGATGGILERKDFADRHWVDRMVGTGVAAHEGRLFGWPNQLLGLITATGLILLCASAVVMWWRRREAGELGTPKMGLRPRFSVPLVLVVGALAVYLPLFGATLVLVKLLEWGVLRRIPTAREWLGLSNPGASLPA